jgi:chromosome segregation ATPase
MSTKTRDKDDADNKLKGARQRKESADHFLKTRTTEIETLKRQIKEKKEKIEKVKQVCLLPSRAARDPLVATNTCDP